MEIAASHHAVQDVPAKPRRIYRHRLPVRLMHWINVVCLTILLMSGLNIFNAHPALYWGRESTFADPWISIGAQNTPEGPIGVTRIAGREFVTTGVLGLSDVDGQPTARAFPSWATIPGPQWLAMGRNWHLFFAWVFGINGLIYILTGLLSRHFLRDLAPTGADARGFFRDALHHLTFHTPTGQAATRYIGAQKLLYLGMIFLVLPVIILTGMTMSPGLNAAFPFLLDLFGGRQSARSIHFICATLIVLFVIVHVLMVLLTGPINQLRGMITGKYAIVPDEQESAP